MIKPIMRDDTPLLLGYFIAWAYFPGFVVGVIFSTFLAGIKAGYKWMII